MYDTLGHGWLQETREEEAVNDFLSQTFKLKHPFFCAQYVVKLHYAVTFM